MELSELAQTRLITMGIILILVAFWTRGIVGGRRRQAHFATLAQSFGGKVTREGKFLSRFPAEIDGRTFDVRFQHIGGGGSGGGGWTPDWYVVTETALQGVSDLHSAEIRARGWRPGVAEPRESDFEKHFTVRDAGYPLRQGWLNDRVRGAIYHFYALELPPDPLGIEEGSLIHRAHLPVRRLDGALLRELLTRQGAVAAALERAL
jgi:hypothetical protein